MKKSITVASLIMGVGALLVLIFSFLDFYSAGSGDFEVSSSAWGGDFGLAPATFVPVVLAIAMLVFVVLDLVGVKLPPKVLTFDWKQIYVFLGVSTAALMIAWLLTGPGGDSGGVDKGAGLILMLIGSLAMAAGSVMNLLGMGANTVNIPQGGSSTPSAPVSGAGAPPPPPPPGAGSPPPPPPPV